MFGSSCDGSSNEYCFQSAAKYTWNVGPAGQSTVFYPDFRTVYVNTVGSTTAALQCGSQAMATALGVSLNEIINGQDQTGYYFSNLQAALASAYDSGVAGGVTAWNRAMLSGIHPDYSDVPIWAVIPRNLNQPTIQVSLTANPTTIAPGASATLTWSSSNATGCTASGGWSGSEATSGTATVGPLQATTSYTLSCTSSTLGTVSSTAVVTVASTPAPTVTISANPTSVASGGVSTLTWSSTNATTCAASGGWSGNEATQGTQTTGALTTGTTFTLTCTGAGGSGSGTATVSITSAGGGSPPPSPPPSSPPPAGGGSSGGTQPPPSSGGSGGSNVPAAATSQSSSGGGSIEYFTILALLAAFQLRMLRARVRRSPLT